nr:peptide-methionine (R)-S-oxide reductase MsrB [Akkermansiaceae bacterium]
MRIVSGLSAVALLLGISFLQLACGDANADDKKKAAKTESKAPAQPTKPVKKTDEEWRKQLTPEQYYILRKHGTERAWGKAYEEFKKQGEGTYYCVGCDAELFTSREKFDARCGWPAFFDASKHENVKTLRDFSAGMIRVEVRCNVCDGHLGHVFEGEGFNTPTDQRYCINGKV